MARPSPPSDNRFQGFKAGVNNVAAGTRPTKDEFGTVQACMAAVNIDFDSAGRARMRRGTAMVDARVHHSLTVFADQMLAVANGDMVSYSDNGATLSPGATIVPGLGNRFVSYATDDLDLHWSNGFEIGRLDPDLVPHPVWLDTPDPLTVAAVAYGGLATGRYEVSATVRDLDGRESGASVCVPVDVADGGGIAVTFPEVPAGADHWSLYVTGANGDVLYFAQSHPIAVTTVAIGFAVRGKQLRTDNCYPMPPCDYLAYWNGRLVGARGNVLVWSEPYALGLTRPENCLIVGNDITLLLALETGLFIADHKATYFFEGTTPNEWRQVRKHPHAAVPYSGVIVSGLMFGLEADAPVAVWQSAAGLLMLGARDGSVKALRDDALAMPVAAEYGATAVFEFDGMRQVASSAHDGGPNARAAAASSVDFIVRRHGVTI